MLLPWGLNALPVRRFPWATLLLVVVNLAVFVALEDEGAEQVTAARHGEFREYWRQHPYLQPPTRFALVIPAGADPHLRWEAQPEPEAPPASQLTEEQAELERRFEAYLAASDAEPRRVWAQVPARGLFDHGLFTNQFVHGDSGHLFWNLVVFLATGAFLLEDVWGAWLFLSVVLAGGVVSSLPAQLATPDSLRAGLGASGAISAALGAVAVRLAHRRIRLTHLGWGLLVSSIAVPVWAYALFVFAGDLLGVFRFGGATGTDYASHVAGFAFGALVALALRRTSLERRLAPAGVVPTSSSAGLARADDALAAGDVATERKELEALLAASPRHPEALLRLVRLEASRRDDRAASRTLGRLLALRLDAGDEDGARAALEEFRSILDLSGLPGAIAYRAAVAVAASDAELTERLEAVAVRAGGIVALKARLFAAERLRASSPLDARRRAHEVADDPTAPAMLRATARALLADIRGASPERTAERETLELDLGDRSRADGAFTIAPVSDDAGHRPVARVIAAASVHALPLETDDTTPAHGQPGESDGAEYLDARCDAHPGVRAGWRCPRCFGLLCAGCTACYPAGTGRLDVCARCGAVAVRLRAHRRLLTPLRGRLVEALGYPVRRGNWRGYAGLAAVVAVATAGANPFFSLIGLPVAAAVSFASLMLVIRTTANGEHVLEPPDFTEAWADLGVPLVRGLAACWPALAAGFVIWAFGGEEQPGLTPERALDLVGYVFLCWLYLPAALLLAASGVGAMDLLSVPNVGRAALRLGGDYVLAASFVLACLLAETWVFDLAARVVGTDVIFVSRFAGTLLALYLPLVAARALGHVLRVRGDAIGVEVVDGYLDPILPRAVPAGRAPGLVRDPPPSRRARAR